MIGQGRLRSCDSTNSIDDQFPGKDWTSSVGTVHSIVIVYMSRNYQICAVKSALALLSVSSQDSYFGMNQLTTDMGPALASHILYLAAMARFLIPGTYGEL